MTRTATKPKAKPKAKPKSKSVKKPTPIAVAKSVSPTSMFDHAQTTEQNYRHWVNADSYGPVTSLDPDVRKIVRERARYERDNDPHLAGLVKTMAIDTVGTGPRLQLIAPDAPAEDVRAVEKLFASWARVTKLAEKLRLMVSSRRVDGEVFATIRRDDKVHHPVKLRLDPFESDLVCEPFGASMPDGNWDDGIEYDDLGNPTRYAIQKNHPGDGIYGFRQSEYTVVDTDFVLHYFHPVRPGQRRGISDFVSALGTIAQLRRYGNATLSAAEFAASISGTMETDGAPEDGPVAVNANETFKLYQNLALTLPSGWKLNQLKPEQPTSTYKEFSSDKRNEMGRPVGAPYNVISGNSSGYNYSSGRLDHVPYHRQTWIDRDDLETSVVDVVIRNFLREAMWLKLIPPSLGSWEEMSWECQWDGFNSIDPYKDAQASQLRLQIGLTTLAEECAAEGRNWRDVLEQQSVEQELRRQLGLTVSPSESGLTTLGDEQPPDDELDDADDTALDRPSRRAERVPA